MVEGAVEEGKSVLVMPLLLSYGGIEDGIRHRLEGLEEPLVRILCGEHCVDVVGFLGGAAFRTAPTRLFSGKPARPDRGAGARHGPQGGGRALGAVPAQIDPKGIVREHKTPMNRRKSPLRRRAAPLLISLPNHGSQARRFDDVGDRL